MKGCCLFHIIGIVLRILLKPNWFYQLYRFGIDLYRDVEIPEDLK